MERKPPLIDRELLKLLEAGHGQSEAARLLGYPIGTVTGKVKKLRDRGILGPGNLVDWDELAKWEHDHQPQAYREKVLPKGNTVVPNVVPKVIPTHPPQFNDMEAMTLREVIAWWEKGEGTTQVLPEVIPKGTTVIPEGITPKTRRTFWIEDGLYEALKRVAGEHGQSMADLVNEAIRAYLEGQPGGRGE